MAVFIGAASTTTVSSSCTNMSSPPEYKTHSRTHSGTANSPHHHHHTSHSPPTQVFHPASPLSPPIPTPSLLESVAGAAHYSGVPVDADVKKRHRRHSSAAMDLAKLIPDHQRVLDDLRELYCCRPTKQIIDRLFRQDVEFEVRVYHKYSFVKLRLIWSRASRTRSRNAMASVNLLLR